MNSARRLLGCLLVWVGSVQNSEGGIMRRVVPLRFDFPASYAPSEADSGWKPFPMSPILQEFRVYARANAVPYAFDACANLVVEFDGNDIWPGNTFQCQVWLEPYDAVDITEIRCDYGAEFGVQIRNRFSGLVVFSHTFDFMLTIEGHGGLPIGAHLIGGWDTLDFVNIPIDQLLPGSSAASHLVGGMLDLLDNNGLSVGAVQLLGELVVQGHSLSLRVGETDVVIEGAGPSHARTAFVYVPLALGESFADTFEIPVDPIYNFSIWKGAGFKFTAVGPLSLTLAPGTIGRLGDMLPGDYAPPAVETVENAYQQAVTRVGTRSRGALWISLPVNGRPLLPDLAIHDIVINPHDPNSYGRAFANEETTIAFTLSNVGGLATQPTDDLSVHLRGGPERAMVDTLLLNNKGEAPQRVIGIDEQLHLAFTCVFEEGRHGLEISSAHSMVKGHLNGQPIYGLGDPFFANHIRAFDVHCWPGRGAVIGRVFSNPSYPGEGLNGVRVRLSGPHRVRETTTAYDAVSDSNGIYRFNGVGSGEHRVEFLPPAPDGPEDPHFAPRSFVIQHDASSVTDLRSGSGLFMRQFQRLHAVVLDAEKNGIENATVYFGSAQMIETSTNKEGEFTIPGVPPSGKFKLIVEHPDYLIREVGIDISVSTTEQTDTHLSGYWLLPEMVWVNHGRIYLDADEEPPQVELEPFDNNARRASPLSFGFFGSDQDGRYAPDAYRWHVRSTGGALLLEGPWSAWPADAPPGLRAEGTADLASLADGPYRFELSARDRAGNVGGSAWQAFTLDTTPPQVDLVLAEGAAFTVSRRVPVDITITNSEPGTLSLELSNDGTSWSDPWSFMGDTFRVTDWEVSASEAQSGGTATVHARVTDAVGLRTVVSESISLATVGAIRLAHGWEAWPGTDVPLWIEIVPPNGLLQLQLNTYADWLDVGGAAERRYRAQAFTLTDGITFNRLRLNLHQVVGEPPPLSIRIVETLDDGNPSGAGSPLWEWTASAEEVRLGALRAAGNLPPATSGHGTVLPAGTYYAIFGCESEAAEHFYQFHAGNSLYSAGSGLRYDHDGEEWRAEEEVPGIGMPTFAFAIYHSPNGEIRICTDGVPDTEPWVALPAPDDPFRTVAAPGEGLFTVIVEYRNTVDDSRDGMHVDTVVVDTSPPVVHNVAIAEVDRRQRKVLMNLNVTDARTRVAAMRWRFDLGPWQSAPFRNNPFIACPPSFDAMTWVFTDAANNSTAPTNLYFPVDISAPTLDLGLWSGDDYVRTPDVRWRIDAHDDTAIDRVWLREIRTGSEYVIHPPFDGGRWIQIPQVIVGWKGETPLMDWVDGIYTFEAVAYDSSENASATVVVPITFDRRPPVLHHVALSGPGLQAPVTSPELVLHVHAYDNLDTLEMRWRWAGEAWPDDWQPVTPDSFGLAMDGHEPLPTRYDIEVQVRDGARWTVETAAGVRTNRPPATPVGLWPFEGSGDPPTLFGSDFSDPDNDRWRASQFTVRADSEIALDTGLLEGARRYAAPDGWLQRDVKYKWRCRYLDEYGAWSGWSEWITFDLQQDSDGDGLPDDLERTLGTDPHDPDTDGDGSCDLQEYLLGTDPLDPESLFRIVAVHPAPGGRLRITWQARGGNTYSVLEHECLAGTAPPKVVATLEAAGGTHPWYTVFLDWLTPDLGASKRFYSIRFEP